MHFSNGVVDLPNLMTENIKNILFFIALGKRVLILKMRVNIKKASIEDKQEVLALCRFFYNRWSPYTYQYFKNKWDGLYKQVVVATLESRIIGYLAFRTPNSDRRFKDMLYISDLYVLPKHREKGIGTKLVEFAERIKNERKLGRLIVNVDKNSNSIKFYNELGFKIYKKSHKSCKLIKKD